MGLSWAAGSRTIVLVKTAIHVKLEQDLNHELLQLLLKSCDHTAPSGSKMHFGMSTVSSSF